MTDLVSIIFSLQCPLVNDTITDTEYQRTPSNDLCISWRKEATRRDRLKLAFLVAEAIFLFLVCFRPRVRKGGSPWMIEEWTG